MHLAESSAFGGELARNTIMDLAALNVHHERHSDVCTEYGGRVFCDVRP